MRWTILITILTPIFVLAKVDDGNHNFEVPIHLVGGVKEALLDSSADGFKLIEDNAELLRAVELISPGADANAVRARALTQLDSDFPEVRSGAASVLGRIPLEGDQHRVVASLVARFEDRSGEAAKKIIAAAERVATGDDREFVVKALRRLIASGPGPAIEFAAMATLGRLAPSPGPATPIDDGVESGVDAHVNAEAALGVLVDWANGNSRLMRDEVVRNALIADRYRHAELLAVLLGVMSDKGSDEFIAAAALSRILTPKDHDAVIAAARKSRNGGATWKELLRWSPAFADSLSTLNQHSDADGVVEAIIDFGRDGVFTYPGAEMALMRVGFRSTPQLWMYLAKVHEGNILTVARWRAVARVAAGNHADWQHLLAVMGQRSANGFSPEVDRDTALEVLGTLSNAWPTQRTLQIEVGSRVKQLLDIVCAEQRDATGTMGAGLVLRLFKLPLEGWSPRCMTDEELALVKSLAEKLREAGEKHSAADVAAFVEAEESFRWSALAGKIEAFGLIVCVLLLTFFPFSSRVQSFFLFHPFARAVVTAGIVPIALTLIPGLRRWLLRPFGERLLASAHLDQFREEEWFAGTKARDRKTGATPLLQDLAAKLAGMVVIEGEPGLGKTMFLQVIAKRSKKPVAYLNARDCDATGVAETIARKIGGFTTTQGAERHGAIKSMIYSRDLVVIVDGLNEVSAEKRGEILKFAEESTKGTIILATQPLAWKPPDAARHLEILPLGKKDVREFLRTRGQFLDETCVLRGADYEAAVETWCREVLESMGGTKDEQVSPLLTNPFDLTLVSELIGLGDTPKPGEVVEQQLARVAADYARLHKHPFPQEKFAELALAKRLDDSNELKLSDAPDELPFLKSHRLVNLWTVAQTTGGGAKSSEDLYRFRHERIQNVFLKMAFDANPKRQLQFVDDARFRGVYLVYAQQGGEHAEKLFRLVVERGVERADHSLSDAFVKLLKKREAELKASVRLKPASVGK
ncbi:hypothetical protein ACN47A_07800 [Myxococcus fulvus]|uniref:hypothetical protein n=1 Tax=Myxococcus fulvus TaxID=33 RepID=UPI003B9B604E